MSSFIQIHWGIVSTAGCLHHIHLSHHLISGKRIIALDGKVILDETRFVDAGSQHEMLLSRNQDGRQDHVLLKIVSVRMGTSYRYDLLINGNLYEDHNLNLSKNLRVWNLNSIFGNNESTTASCLLSAMVPEILQVYYSRCTEGITDAEAANDISNNAATSAAYRVESVPSTLGFGADETPGVVHNLTVDSVHFELYSDVVQDEYHVKCVDSQEIISCLTYADLLQNAPEFNTAQVCKITRSPHKRK
jgi:hypothetical protein